MSPSLSKKKDDTTGGSNIAGEHKKKTESKAQSHSSNLCRKQNGCSSFLQVANIPNYLVIASGKNQYTCALIIIASIKNEQEKIEKLMQQYILGHPNIVLRNIYYLS